MKIELVQNPKTEIENNTIYVDGACVCSFIDLKRNSYSFDHHGEFRFDKTSAAFQTAMAILQGLDVSTIEKVYVSSIDADSVLSCLLLKSPKLTNDLKLIRLIQDLSRIDNHGPAACVPGEAFSSYHYELKSKRDEIDSTELLLEKINLAEKMYLDKTLFAESVEQKTDGIAVALDVNGQIIFTTWGEVSFADIYKYSAFGALFFKQGDNLKVTIGKKPFVKVQSLKSLWSYLSSKEKSIEDTWGGADSIGGSPFKNGTCLTKEEVIGEIKNWINQNPS